VCWHVICVVAGKIDRIRLLRERRSPDRPRGHQCAAGTCAQNLIKLNVAIICLAPEVTAEGRSRAQKAHVLPALLQRRGDIKFY